MTRLRGRRPRRCRPPDRAGATGRALPRSTLSATSRSASSRRWARFCSLKKCSSAQGILSARVDLPGAQALLQVLDGEVQVHDLVRLLEEAVGDGLAHADARRALDHVVQALQVLHVERADDVDAGVEQLDARPGSASCCGCRGRSCAPARRRAPAPGLRARMLLRLISSMVTPRYSIWRRGTTSSPSIKRLRLLRARASRRSRRRRRRRAS